MTGGGGGEGEQGQRVIPVMVQNVVHRPLPLNGGPQEASKQNVRHNFR